VTSTPEILRAETDQAGRIAGLLAEAFEPLPVSAWLVSDPDERHRVLTANFQIFVEHAFPHGRVEVTGDLDAAAVWFHGSEFPPPPDYEARLVDACGRWLDRFQILDEQFAANHPHDHHHHLAFLGVQANRQSTGLGSVLMGAHHRRLDEAGIPGYLEASSLRSRELYLRHGYRLMGDPFYLPDGPPFWPMWREPRPPR
jgi:GNAT superfamily N-acetyltransferase